MFAFVMPNIDRLKTGLAPYAFTIDSIEKFTGLDFFLALRQAEGEELEEKVHALPVLMTTQQRAANYICDKSVILGIANSTFRTLPALLYLARAQSVYGTIGPRDDGVGGPSNSNLSPFMRILYTRSIPSQFGKIARSKCNVRM